YDGHPHGQRLGPGAARAHAARCPNEARCNAEQGHCDVRRRYTRATGRPKKPTAWRGRQGFNRKILQITSPVIEERPIWLLRCASFGSTAPRQLLLADSLLGAPYARKSRKTRKVRGCWSVTA